MVLLVLMLAVLIVPSVGGGAALSPLPVRDGCYLVSPEINVLRVEGEAIILSFPMFERVLEVHNIASPTAKYLITKGNGTQGGAYHGEGRVQQRDNQLWLLPAQAADSGEYICTYRNETYCVTGSIGLHVYESGSADVEKLSYPIPVSVGEYLRLSCPSLSDFNSTDRLIEWHKDSGLTRRSGRVQGSFQQHRGKLLIPAVRRSHAGVYTCRLRALIDDQQYKVSRTVVLNVEGVDPVTTTTTTDPVTTTTTTTDPVTTTTTTTTTDPVTTTTTDPVTTTTTTTTTIEPVTTTTVTDPVTVTTTTTTTIEPVTTTTVTDPVTVTTTTTTIEPVTTTTVTDPVTVTTTDPDLSGTSDPGLTSSSFVSVHTIQPPVILSPRNGTVFESLHGSGLELSCTVLTECQTADYTVVTWLVNNQSVESSYLDGRALQGGRRVTGASEGCHIELRLVVVTMTDEDVNAELRCVAQNRAGRQEVVIRLQLEDSTFTWLVVAAATVSCFLTVVSVFLYVLFKPNGRNKADYFLARQNSSF